MLTESFYLLRNQAWEGLGTFDQDLQINSPANVASGGILNFASIYHWLHRSKGDRDRVKRFHRLEHNLISDQSFPSHSHPMYGQHGSMELTKIVSP